MHYFFSTTIIASLLLSFSVVSEPSFFALAFTAPPAPPSFRSTALARPTTRLFNNNKKNNDNDDDSSFTVGVLGDLHMDPRKLADYDVGRDHFAKIFSEDDSSQGRNRSNNNNKKKKNVALVSLGDLGESKAVWPDSDELFSGTTACHELAADYLGSFGVPYEMVGGNHDLEGIDEFATDQENLEMMLRVHNKPTPQFYRQVADKTVLIGLSSTVFREAPFTSHEVIIDEAQMQWFEETLEKHPASEGWKVFVFTHAPPLGSGLKVLAENHVVNGCCWLNQSNEEQCRRFIELVRKHRSIKAWFSGHFHLGQDYQESITFPNEQEEKDDGMIQVDRGSCVFCQTSVMRDGTSRDGCQQSRLIRGKRDGFEICTVDHQEDGKVRVDAVVTYSDCDNEVGTYVTDDENDETEQFEQLYKPVDQHEDDSAYLPEDALIEYDNMLLLDEHVTEDTTAWFYLNCGRVLGMYNGMLLEYDPLTLAPLGLVVSADELVGKRVAVIDVDNDNEEDEETIATQAVVLIDEDDASVVVIQPNEDGSYWRKIVRNKLVRMREMRREKAAKKFAQQYLETKDAQVVSSWGPYKTTSGVAKSTGESELISAASREDEERLELSQEFAKFMTAITVPFKPAAASALSLFGPSSDEEAIKIPTVRNSRTTTTAKGKPRSSKTVKP